MIYICICYGLFILIFNFFLVHDGAFEYLMQTKDLKGISIDLLIPGMMVNARVKSVLENGVLLSFLNYFSGTVSVAFTCHDCNA